MKMDKKAPATLLEIAAQSLLRNEPAAIQALEEVPRDLFVPLFTAAFLGGRKKILKAMVRVWPFHCLHIGILSAPNAHYEILEALIDGLPILPSQNSSSWGPKLRVLDLRLDPDCRTTCSEIKTTCPFCFQSCICSQRSILNGDKAQHSVRCLRCVHSETEPRSSGEPMELLVELSLNDNLRTRQFLSFLKSKVNQSSGSLHLCCRELQIVNISAHKSFLQILDLGCTEYLEVNEARLNEVTTLLARMIHLDRLTLSKISSKSCKGRNFRTFLTHLRRMDNLQELSLSFFYLSGQLHRLLRVLPPQMDALCLSVCGLSDRDITALSQSPQAKHLTLLNLSNNDMSWASSESFQVLLETASGTLQYLELNNCLITDSTLSPLIPILSRCSHLRVLSFAFNPITMPVLTSLLRHLTALMDLKLVICPVPVHCYEHWNLQDSLDQGKCAEVQAQLRAMLQAVQRKDMHWTIRSK